LKISNPIQVAEYARAHGIINKPVFSWWTKDILKCKERILSAIGVRHARKNYNLA
jgi:hypothetical protein